MTVFPMVSRQVTQKPHSGRLRSASSASLSPAGPQVADDGRRADAMSMRCVMWPSFCLGYQGKHQRLPMLIRPFLSGQAFDPETIDKMSEALKGVCEMLSLKLMDGPETRLVAQKIIEISH